MQNEQNEQKKHNTVQLAYKAFREVISVNPRAGIAYPVIKNIKSVVDVYAIFVMGQLIDAIADYLLSTTEFNLDEFLQSDVMKFFIILIILDLVTVFLEKAGGYLKTLLSDEFWAKFLKKGIDKIANLNLEDVESKKVQTLLTNVQAFSWDATWDTYVRITDMGYHVIMFASAGYIIATQMSLWGLLVIFLVIPEAIFRYRYNVKIKEFRDENAEKRQFFQYLQNQSKLIRNFPELRVDNVFKFFSNSFEKTANRYYKKQNRIRLKRDTGAFFWYLFDGSLRMVVQILLIPVAIVQHYSIGTFKYLFDYIDKLYSSSWNVIWQSLMIKSNSLYVRDYFDLFEYKGFGDITSGVERFDKLHVPGIEFINVDFKYPDSPSAALSDVSFRIEPGEKVAIIGHDNSGKSTIAKLICGLYRVGPGDILVDDISVKNLDRGELKDRISVVFENYMKYNFSIRKNITVTQPERDFNRRLYEEALEITDLDKWIQEEGIKDSQILGKLFGTGMEVSTGHWQRIAIARAIYRDRMILILDESMTQIDSFSRRPILEGIIKHRPKQTFINITQEETDRDLFDKIIYIEKGGVKEVVEQKRERRD